MAYRILQKGDGPYFCYNCGEQARVGAKFCPACGAPYPESLLILLESESKRAEKEKERSSQAEKELRARSEQGEEELKERSIESEKRFREGKPSPEIQREIAAREKLQAEETRMKNFSQKKEEEMKAKSQIEEEKLRAYYEELRQQARQAGKQAIAVVGKGAKKVGKAIKSTSKRMIEALKNAIEERKKKEGDKQTAIGDDLVRYTTTIPKNATVYLKVPFVPNGFENSCSEASAEMILRFWGVVGWSQYEIHSAGYQTFEGGVAEGDLGLLNMFRYEDFQDAQGNKIKFKVSQLTKGNLKDLQSSLDNQIPPIIRIYTVPPNKHTVVLIGYNRDGFWKHDNDEGSSLFISNKYLESHWTGNYLVIQKV